MEPLLSVIVPVYNAQKYLLACYNSLKQQTYPNLEFIFVDDGSTDASFKLLCDLKKRDNRVKVISQTNQGQVLARKAGLAAACGDYIAFTKMVGGAFYIGVMYPDGTGERILADGYLVEGPTWSPNGRVLMFFRQDRGSPVRLYTIDLTGYNERRVVTPSEASDPAWSPLLPL